VKKLVEVVFTIIIFMFLVVSILGYVLDRPVFISYASSGSMTPTIREGDAFFINPFKSPEVGDIIIFEANGKWTVHRIVGEMDGGFITKGDNNVATDQQNGKPPISYENVAGTVLTVNGHPLLIKGLGNTLSGVSFEWKLVLSVLILIAGISTLNKKTGRRKKNEKKWIKLDFKLLYLALSVTFISVFVFSSITAWETERIDYVVTSAGSVKENWYLPETTFERQILIKNQMLYPQAYFLSWESDRVRDVSEDSFVLMPGESKEIFVSVTTPSDTSIFSEKMYINGYLLSIPPETVKSLYAMHPSLPIVASIIEILAILFVIYKVSGIGNEEFLRINKRKLRRLRL